MTSGDLRPPTVGALSAPLCARVRTLCAILDRLHPRADGRAYAEQIGFVADRPGHDRRYALDCTKLRGLGWERRTDFDTGLALTVEWFRENRPWWEAIKNGEAFADYASKNYDARA